MANITGKDGTVNVGANAIAEVRDWSIETSSDMVSDTVMGDTWVTNKPTLKSWTCSVNCYLDASDTTGQGAFLEGAEFTLNLYPSGNTSSNELYTGAVVVSGVSKSASFDGLVEVSFSATGSGALIISTVA